MDCVDCVDRGQWATTRIAVWFQNAVRQHNTEHKPNKTATTRGSFKRRQSSYACVVVVGSDHGKQRAATQDATRRNATQRRATGRERSSGDASNDDELGRQTCPLSLLWFRMSVHVFIAVP